MSKRKRHDKADWHDKAWVDPDLIGWEHEGGSFDTPPTGTIVNPSLSQGGQFGGTTYTYNKLCKSKHDGRSVIFQFSTPSGHPITFGGATGWNLDEDCADIIIDCAHVTGSTKARAFVEDGPKEWQALNALATKPRATIVKLDWPDAKAPTKVGYDFWRKAATLIGRSLPNGGHVVVTCVGGHGRTGTCLASLLITCSGRTSVSAIDYIRERHCQDAIETKGQEDYLDSLAAERDARQAQEKKEQPA